MTRFNKKNIVFALIIYLFLSTTGISACECGILPFEDAVENSTVIFSGKIIGYEYRKNIPNSIMDAQTKLSGAKIDYETLVIKFQVERRWKGEAPSEIFLITNRVKTGGRVMRSSCDYDFKENENYLIYASGKKSELRTTFCLRTKPLSTAQADLDKLGKGKKPLKVKKPLD